MLFFNDALPFIKEFIEKVDSSLSEMDQGNRLSTSQKAFLAFCLMGILVTNSINWSKFFRASVGQKSPSRLSWMFHKSKIFWDKLLTAAVMSAMKEYDLTSGVLVIDDTDKKRSKSTKKIHGVHKIYDKKSSGYFKGQNIVFLLLVTKKVTIPVGFEFYLKEKKTKIDIAIDLLKKFKLSFPLFKINAILADAFYASKEFFEKNTSLFPKSQIISQVKKNHQVNYKGIWISAEEYFRRCPGVESSICIRGAEDSKKIFLSGARVKLKAHEKKRFIVALKYEGEEEYRYIIASDLTWRMQDIIETYTLRWLIEVFFQDWKSNEGWGEVKQHRDDGSECAVILSLLYDISLVFHPTQKGLVENRCPALTVGSLIEQCKIDCFFNFFQHIFEQEKPEDFASKIQSSILEICKFHASKKQMCSVTLGRMEPSHSLRYRKAA